MKKTKLLFLSLLIFTGLQKAYAQLFPGYNTSNYAGINAVAANPANVVDSRYMVDINLIGINFVNENNYIGLNSSEILNGHLWNTSRADYTAFQNANLYERSLGNRNFSLTNNINIMGPSFLVSLKHGWAFGVTTQMRSIFNVDGVDPDLAKLSYYQLEYPSLYHQNLSTTKFSVREMTWSDIGLTAGKVIIDSRSSFLKVGATVKVLMAQNSIYLRADNLPYEWNNDHILNISSADFQYGVSKGFPTGDYLAKNQQYNPTAQDLLAFHSNPTLGLDLGAEYEYRPDYAKYSYNMDGKTNLKRNDLNKYKWKVGASITDIGWIKFNRPDSATNFNAHLTNFDINKFGPGGIHDFNDSLYKQTNNFTVKSTKGAYRVQLPMAFQVHFDYHFYKGFYANATYFGDMTLANTDPAHVHQVSYVMITPRWDSRFAGVFIPITYDAMHNVKTGISLHLGPIIVGSNSLFNVLLGKHVYSPDFHFAIKIPIFQTKPHDKDHDGVSDRKDKCPRDSGSWATKGCPDRDGDGVPDKEDKCPDVKGSPDHHGCPDTDGDGVYDDEDQCPTVKGTIANHGCPEVKAPDSIFKKPEPPVLKKPDTAVVAKPTPAIKVDTVKPAPPVVKLDTVKPAPPVVKKDTIKPTPPVIVKKPEPVVENIPDHFNNLHFDLAKAVLSAEDDAELDVVSAILKKHPNWQVNVSGHADNTGTAAINSTVSQARATAVKQFLMNKGVKASQIKTEWHGADIPVGDNGTDAGRAQNRRVEIKLIQN